MKNTIKYFLLLLISAASFVGCSDDTDNLFKSFNDFNFISFLDSKSSTLTVQENAGTVSIPVVLSSPVATDLQVSLTLVDDTAVQGEDYTFTSTTITIPAGQVNGAFELSVVDDAEFNESKFFSIELTTNVAGVVAGLAGNSGTFKKNVVIVNDDCPTKYSLWFGAISVEDVGYGSTAGSASATPSGTCDILRVDHNLAGWTSGLSNQLYDFRLIPYGPGESTGVVELDDTKIGNANFNFGGGAEPGDVYYTISYGEYDEDTKVIEVDYAIRVKQLSTGTMFNLTGWSGTTRIIKP